jgi:cation-transporting ATPase 13A1
VLALGTKEMKTMKEAEINKLGREQVETGLTFVGFLVFHCPLKPDAVESIKMLSDSSHRVSRISSPLDFLLAKLTDPARISFV